MNRRVSNVSRSRDFHLQGWASSHHLQQGRASSHTVSGLKNRRSKKRTSHTTTDLDIQSWRLLTKWKFIHQIIHTATVFVTVEDLGLPLQFPNTCAAIRRHHREKNTARSDATWPAEATTWHAAAASGKIICMNMFNSLFWESNIFYIYFYIKPTLWM
jgi:hypothetical protein